MLNADQAPYFETCPRCGIGGYERLSTHSHCVGCNYSPDFEAMWEPAIPQWAIDALKEADRQKTKSSDEGDEQCVA